MSNSHSDRNLLLGILALQFGLVTREQLIAGISTWGTDPSQQLDEVFRQLKFITEDGQQKLQALFEMHLQMHGCNVEKSLAALSSVAEVRHDLERVELADLEQSLQKLLHGSVDETEPPRANADPDATLTVGQPTSSGTRFRILRPHAKGGLGEVSVALDSELNREVALKEIQRQHAYQADNRSRFMLEAQITGSLEHPGIVPVYGMGTYADGRPFYAMRFIRGDSLKDGIQKFFASYAKGTSQEGDDKPLKLPARAYESFKFRKLLQRFIDVCNAIAYAHARGVLHRDLKPGNIMLGKYGETLVVDWGLAKAVGRVSNPSSPSSAELETSQPPLTPPPNSDSAQTLMGSAFGTPAYMSPEQAAGRVDLFSPATDIYCLGATLYHLLTGGPPHRGKEIGQLLLKICSGEFRKPRDLNAAIPAPLAAICVKAMAVDQVDRYDSAESLSADVEHWLADDPVSAHQDSPISRLQRWTRRHRSLVTAIGALVLTATIALAIGYFALHMEQRRTLAAKKNADNEKTAAQSAQQRAEEAERRERNERQKTELALTQSQDQLAANHFQQGVSEYEAGRLQQAFYDLDRAASLTSDKQLAESIRRVLVDRMFQRGKLLLPYLRHRYEVTCANFSPNGKLLITASGGTSQVWDAQRGTPLGKMMQHNSSVMTANFSFDGTRVITASADESARIWNAVTGLQIGDPLQHNDTVLSASFSPDGKRVLTVSGKNTATLWNAETGMRLGQPMQHGKLITTCSFSPDGSRLVTASKEDFMARTWDGFSGAPIGTLFHETDVESARFSPDGSRIVTASSDEVRLWNSQTNAPVGPKFQQSKDVRISPDGLTGDFYVKIIVDAKFSPDGMRILSIEQNNSAQLWNAATGLPLGSPIRHVLRICAAEFSLDGSRVVTASEDRSARLWDAHTGLPLGTPFWHDAEIDSANFSADGARLVTASRDKSARVWNTQTHLPLAEPSQGTELFPSVSMKRGGSVEPLWDAYSEEVLQKRLDHEAIPVASSILSPDRTQILTTASNSAHLWNAMTGEIFGQPLRHDDYIQWATFSPDGKWVVTASQDNTARLWNASTGTSHGPPLKHAALVAFASFSPDSKRVVTASDDSTAQIWEVRNGSRVGEAMRHDYVVNSASFSPDGTQIVTASADKSARIWNAENGKPAGKSLPHDHQVETASFSPDGAKVITVSPRNTVHVWDVQRGIRLGRPIRHEDYVTAASFSPDGKRLVTSSADKSTRLWDLHTGTMLGEPFPHVSWVEAVNFNTDGSRVFTISDDYVRVWDGRRSVTNLANDDQAFRLLRSVFSCEANGDRILFNEYNEIVPDSKSDDERLKALNALQSHPVWQANRQVSANRPKHRYFAGDAEKLDRWFAAAWHLECLVKEHPDDAKLKARWETARQKWAEQQAEWERKGKEANAAREEVRPKNE